MKISMVFTMGIFIALLGFGCKAEQKETELPKNEQKAERLLKKADKDKDDRISLMEYNDHELVRFIKKDHDSDGFLILSEWGQDRAKSFDRADSDNDRKVSKEEWLERRRKVFKRLDVDKDGYLSFKEISGPEKKQKTNE